jgi:hypothetical protein
VRLILRTDGDCKEECMKTPAQEHEDSKTAALLGYTDRPSQNDDERMSSIRATVAVFAQ